jgi:hypothetical protein
MLDGANTARILAFPIVGVRCERKFSPPAPQILLAFVPPLVVTVSIDPRLATLFGVPFLVVAVWPARGGACNL